MFPILLKGHERSITKILYNREGDILFSVSKDNKPTAWWSDNGERIGTYNGHKGAVWDCDVTDDSKYFLTGSADGCAKVFNVRYGEQILSLRQQGPVRCVGWSEGYKFFFCVSNPLKKTADNNSSLLCIYQTPSELINDNGDEGVCRDALKEMVPIAEIPVAETTCGAWLPMNRGIILGCNDGVLRIYRAGENKASLEKEAHKGRINDLQFNRDKTLFITSSTDHVARLFDVKSMKCLKTFRHFVPVNSASIHPVFEHVMFGGGQDAMSVTTTDAREGGFETRFFHMIFEKEFGRVKGHFGPVNTLAFRPDGLGFASGGEGGFIRLPEFTVGYLTKQQKMDKKLEKSNRLAQELIEKGLLEQGRARLMADE